MEEFGCPFTFAETKSGEQSLFQISVLVVSRWSRECIEDSTRCFLIQSSNYMVIFCGIIFDLADVKLCFSLQKPDLRLLCPEIGSLMATALVSVIFFRKFTIYRVGVTNEEHHNMTLQELCSN